MMAFEQTFLLTQVLISWALLTETLELLSWRNLCTKVWKGADLTIDGKVWPIGFQAVFEFLIQDKMYLFLLGTRLLLALLLLGIAGGSALHLFYVAPYQNNLLVFLLFMLSAIVYIRGRGTVHGGSDFMTLAILQGLLLSQFFIESPGLSKCGLMYIALQNIVSYFIAGVAKIRNANWRTGLAFRGILAGTLNIQIPIPVSLFVTWGLLIFELSFPICLISQKVCSVFIAIAFSFHLANAYFLGLNRFVWAWLASYPALFFMAGLKF